ncbi:MAG: acylneuraminate cytidylyltransferase family protein [Bacteroidota bacterium]
MAASLNILGLIPARGGSKGVPRKNIRPLAGQSLVQRTFSVAQNSGVLHRIILSTEDEEIAQHGRDIGLEVPFLRSKTHARDQSPMIDVLTEALDRLKEEEGYEPDALLLLQPTSPFRKPVHLQRAVELLGDHDSVCTVVPVPLELCPHFVMKITEEGYLDYFLEEGRKIKRRQDVPPAYRREGTVYLTRPAVIRTYGNIYGQSCIPMPISEAESLSIDTEDQWAFAEKMLLEGTTKY